MLSHCNQIPHCLLLEIYVIDQVVNNCEVIQSFRIESELKRVTYVLVGLQFFHLIDQSSPKCTNT